MDSRPPWPFEDELSARPPRSLRLTQARKWTLAASGAALGLALAGGSWGFLSLPIEDRTPVLTLAFLAFAALGGYLTVRLISFEKLRWDLIRGGLPIEGIVFERRRGRGSRAHFAIWYSAEGSEWRIEARGAASLADVGDVVTVLHQPSDPARALVYRFSGCFAGSVEPSGSAMAPAALHSRI